MSPARKARLPHRRWLTVIAAILAALIAAPTAPAQQLVRPSSQPSAPQSFAQRFFAHNYDVAQVQPTFITPAVEPDPRLVQFFRVSVAHSYTPTGTETVNYGNVHGLGIIVGNRYEFDVVQPPYIQHNSATAADGWGDTTISAKARLVSAPAQHGNYIVSALLAHTFATGSHSNGALTDSFTPTLAAAVGVRKRFALESTLGGALPTGKIATQGRTIAWNALVQAHATTHLWLEVENNSTFYFAGAHDGRMQNFVTPAAYYVVRRTTWKPTHPFWIVNAGMQVATSGFHTCNHNLIAETRLIF
jgi:hypothetical protein